MRKSLVPGNNKGFSLIELLVVIGLFGLIIGIAANTFSILLKQSSVQSKTAETQIEGIIGLELLRTDIEHAGLGLPWSFPTRDANDGAVTVSYTEATGSYPSGPTVQPSTYNDATSGIPRAIVTGNGAGLNGSDILVLKGASLARSETSQRWSYIVTEGAGVPKAWGAEDLNDNERVIVMRPNVGTTNPRQLVMVSTNTFYTTYSAASFPSGFRPRGPGEHFLIYGIDPDTNPRMPFNRADYLISNPSGTVPRLCAPNTGVLQKVVVNQSNGNLTNMLPLLDCVADMKFLFGIDNDGNGTVDATSATPPAAAADIRRIKEVTVLILLHEGQIDRSFTYPDEEIAYGGGLPNFKVKEKIGVNNNWQNYRWKVYRFTVKPRNLG